MPHPPKQNVMKEKYILNGRPFKSYDLAVKYCAEMGWRITNTQTISKGVYLLTVSNATA